MTQPTTVYDMENTQAAVPVRLDDNFQLQVRQPLLQGAGVEYNRIAGPQAIPGFNQGVMLARINTDIGLATFEASVRNMVSDVEVAYWELYFAYRNLDTAVVGRDAPEDLAEDLRPVQGRQPREARSRPEAQARAQYFLFRGTAEQGLSTLYQAESKLRYMMGLAATDGRLIRPADEPTTAKIAFDWAQSNAEAIARAVEIREAEVARQAARNGNHRRQELPAAAVGRHRPLSVERPGQLPVRPRPRRLRRCIGHAMPPVGVPELATGDYQSWHLELQARCRWASASSMRACETPSGRGPGTGQAPGDRAGSVAPDGRRDPQPGIQLYLSQTNFNRRVARQAVEAVTAAFEADTVALDLLLDAQRQRAEAESDYFRSLTNT